MAVVILVLIEFNERRKAKKQKVESQKPEDDNCSDMQCAECGLHDVCSKEEKTRK